MRSKTNIFYAVLITAGLFSSVFGNMCCAQTSWASVDFSLLLAIHPGMASFDYSHGRFFRNNLSSTEAAAIGETLQAAWNKTLPKLRELGVKREKLNQAKFETLQRREETMRSLLEKEATNPGQIRDRDKQISEFASRYARELEDCESKLAQVAKEIEQTEEEAYSPVYLTKNETAKQLETIKSEITQLIAQTAQENKIGVVLDTSFGRSYMAKPPESVTIPEYPEPSDTLASRLFHTFSNWEPPKVPRTSVPGPDGKLVSAAEHVMFAMGQNMVKTLEKYLEFKPYLTKAAAEFSSGNIFLVGGKDLTALVAKKLFVRYKVPAEIQNSFQLLIQKYSQFEKANAM